MHPQRPVHDATRNRSHSRTDKHRPKQNEGAPSEDEIDKQQAKHRRMQGRKAVLHDMFVLDPISKPYMYIKRHDCSSVAQKLAARGNMTEREYMSAFMALLHDHVAYDARDFPHMFAHLKCIMEDCARKPWADVREWSQSIFDLVEKHTIDWHERQEIQNDRSNFAPRHSCNPTNTRDERSYNQSSSQRSAGGRIEGQDHERPCAAYNSTKRCTLKQHHQDGMNDVIHACTHCYKVTQAFYEHPEQMCRRKTRTQYSKN